MIALASKPVKTHIVEADYYYRVSLWAPHRHCEARQCRSNFTPRFLAYARNKLRNPQILPRTFQVRAMTKRGAQNDKEGICCASLALDRSGPRGCLKSALVGKGLAPSQFAGAHKGLQYRNFRHMDRLLINVLQVFLHID
jgi:hypothetical protein